MNYTPEKALIKFQDKYYQIDTRLSYHLQENISNMEDVIVIEEVFNSTNPSIIHFLDNKSWSNFMDKCSVLTMNGQDIGYIEFRSR